ncbi:MAG: serine/threonine protein kinase [Kangiellaceae bacterium]|nr:serine/threonine protein kinase [Kangiellaceae bacterium]
MANQSSQNKSKPSQVDLDEIATAISSPDYVEKRNQALTQIGKTLHEQDNQDGFIKAKEDANRALAENKIILKNRFVLEATLGAGGMGTVYKAQDLRKVEAQDTNPYVAAKVLNNDFKEHPDSFIALQREASRSSKLAHPNIVTVHDFDRDGDTIYMTMELLEGEDLDSLLRKKRNQGLPKQQAMQILKDYCNALSFAHKKGIIHCDLKPANIFVTKEGAKVLDFGIARLALQTQDHFDAGKIGALTPAYASIEMFNNESPDQADDVFAAAIIAYELFSGRHPYNSKSAPAAQALKMEPRPIEGLTKKQWRALSSALKLDKAERTKTIGEFLTGMTVKTKFPALVLLTSILALASAGLTYLEFFGEDELNAVVQETLVTAQNCFKSQDFECTISSANAILKIAPDHTEATQLLKDAEAANEQLVFNRNLLLLITDATDCLENRDYVCAITESTEVLELEPGNQQAIEILKSARKAQASIELGFENHMASANLCLTNADYSCAIEEADKALEFKPEAAQAISIKQNADYALKQEAQAQAQALNKARNIVRDGRNCFAKYDYSCAIAKSESALEFVPNYQPALKLKRDAERAIADAKKAIQIE